MLTITRGQREREREIERERYHVLSNAKLIKRLNLTLLLHRVNTKVTTRVAGDYQAASCERVFTHCRVKIADRHVILNDLIAFRLSPVFYIVKYMT